jgi:hypothetical protein
MRMTHTPGKSRMWIAALAGSWIDAVDPNMPSPESLFRQALYAQRFFRQEFNRADALEEGRKGTVGFALTILQRRLASSPEAIYQSLRRRRARLEKRLTELEHEIAHTDSMDFKDMLKRRRDAVQKFLEKLPDSAAIAT